MRWIISAGVSLAILAVAVGVFVLLRISSPEPEQKEAGKALPIVEAVTLQPGTVSLRLPTQGMIEPEQETALAAEVAGKVLWISPRLRPGEAFAENAELLRLDDANYLAARAEARAALADAKLNLEQEKARAEQALADWRRLGRGDEPSDLVLRKPQLESARARIEAAEAAVNRADRDLERTVIRAPYQCRVESRLVDVGAYLAPGTPVAQVHAEAPFEVRLPLSLDEFALVDVEDRNPEAWLRVEAGGQVREWRAKVVRREAEIDRESRSIYLVARVDPGNESGGLMQPGLFVQAEVEGRTLEEIFTVPLVAFRDEREVVLVDAEDRLRFREVNVIRREGEVALVSGGLEPGDRVCLTPLQIMMEGMEVDVQAFEQEPPVESGEPTLAVPRT